MLISSSKYWRSWAMVLRPRSDSASWVIRDLRFWIIVNVGMWSLWRFLSPASKFSTLEGIFPSDNNLRVLVTTWGKKPRGGNVVRLEWTFPFSNTWNWLFVVMYFICPKRKSHFKLKFTEHIWQQRIHSYLNGAVCVRIAFVGYRSRNFGISQSSIGSMLLFPQHLWGFLLPLQK